MSNKRWLVVGIAILVVLTCSISVYKLWPKEVVAEITLTFTENGFKQNVTQVTLSNYHKGARAEVTYRIVNNTGRDIQPSIEPVYTVLPEKYSKIEGKGYVAVPSYYSDWIDKPVAGIIESGNEARYTIVLKIPNDTPEVIPPRWVFQTIVASGTGGFTQVAPGTWWVINMR